MDQMFMFIDLYRYIGKDFLERVRDVARPPPPPNYNFIVFFFSF